MTISKRLYLVIGLIALIALAFSAVTLTSHVTSADPTTPAAQTSDEKDDADDDAEGATKEADNDGVQDEIGPQDEGGDGDDQPITSPALDECTAAALAEHPGGTVTETEVGDDGAAYGVEVRFENGSQVEVNLDENCVVIGQEADDDGPNDQDGPNDD